MTRCAFAPAHITGLFAVHDTYDETLRRGSRGAGWCIQKGAWAAVDHADETRIRINGQPHAAAVTRAALDALAPNAGLDVEIQLDLPAGQGFGMSAAGTLAATLAATSLLDLEPEHALETTHAAEVTHGTGLGDAIGAWFGGGELRLKPGAPPHGWAMHIHAPEDQEFLFCVLGDEIPTDSIIRDEEWKTRTRRHGDDAVDRLLDAGRTNVWPQVLAESNQFSRDLGLMPAAMLALGERLPEGLQWGQAMLGSTMWVTGDVGDMERAEALLETHGPLVRSRVDPNGARLVKSLPRPTA